MLTTVLTEAREDVLLEDDELHGEGFKLVAAEAAPEDVSASPRAAADASAVDEADSSTLLIRTVCSPASSSPSAMAEVDLLVVLVFQYLSGRTWCTGDSASAAA